MLYAAQNNRLWRKTLFTVRKECRENVNLPSGL